MPIGSAISAVAGFFGGRQQNKINQAEAQKNRDFQERMRNTSWQAGVEDMRAAGLNPALAYGQGGAATPGGATSAAAENTVSSAMQAMTMKKNLELVTEQAKKAKAEATSARANARLDDATSNMLFPHDGVSAGPSMLRQKLDKELELLGANVDSIRSTTNLNKNRGDILGPQAELFRALQPLLENIGGRAANLFRRIPN